MLAIKVRMFVCVHFGICKLEQNAAGYVLVETGVGVFREHMSSTFHLAKSPYANCLQYIKH